MMTLTTSRSRADSTTWRSLIAALALVTGFGLPAAFAGGDGNTDPTAPAPAAGDDVTTLPSLAAGEGSGTVFLGKELEIAELLRSARGTGYVEVFPREDGEIAVAFQGDWNLRLRRSVLETTNVRVAFVAGTTFEDGRARLVLGDTKPLALILSRPTLDIPLAELARGDVQGLGWDLLVTSADSDARLRTAALFRSEHVTLVQRTSY